MAADELGFSLEKSTWFKHKMDSPPLIRLHSMLPDKHYVSGIALQTAKSFKKNIKISDYLQNVTRC